MSVLGIKVGRSSCSGMLVSLQGELLAHARQDYIAPVNGPQGSVLDPRMVWRAVRTVISEICKGERTDPVRAICLASASDVMVPIASNGQILGECIMAGSHSTERWLDVGRPSDAMFQEIAGSVPPADGLLAELCWLHERKPALWERLGRLAFTGSWVGHLLGGRMLADVSLASHTNLLDISQGHWSGRLADRCDISRFKLPDVGHAGDALGVCTTGISQQLELPPNVRLFLGGDEVACAALGAGVLTSNAYLHLGSSLVLSPAFQAIPLRSLMAQNELGMWCHVAPSAFVSNLQNDGGGSVLQWLRDLLLPVRPDTLSGPSYNVIERFLAEMPEKPTHLMSLPGFSTSVPPFARSGHNGTILGLDIHTSRGELVKGLLEGMLYELSLGITLMQQVGISIQSLRCAGGGSRSTRWLQLVADVTGLPVERVAPSDPSLLGAAMLAAVGIGAYGSLNAAAQEMMRITARFEPNPALHAHYANRISQFVQIRDALQEEGWYGVKATSDDPLSPPMSRAS